MDSKQNGLFLLDWRNDEKSATEVDRAIFFSEYYGILCGARYLFSKRISLRVSLRTLLIRRTRATRHRYQPISNGSQSAPKPSKVRFRSYY